MAKKLKPPQVVKMPRKAGAVRRQLSGKAWAELTVEQRLLLLAEAADLLQDGSVK